MTEEMHPLLKDLIASIIYDKKTFKEIDRRLKLLDKLEEIFPKTLKEVFKWLKNYTY